MRKYKMKEVTLISLFLLLTVTVSAQQFAPGDHKKIRTGYSKIPVTAHNRGTPANIKTVLYNSGANTTASIAPQGSRRFIRSVYLVTPDEMSESQFGSSTVTSVGWTWIALEFQSASTTGLIRVYLQNTSDTVYSKGTSFTSALAGMTKVIEGSLIIPSGEGTYSIDVPSGGAGTFPFSSSSGSGVYVAIEYTTSGGLALPLGSPTVSGNDSLPAGLFLQSSQTSFSDTLTSFGIRPETRFGDDLPDDVEVLTLYTMGEVPSPFGFPDSLGVLLSTNGSQSVNEVRVTSQNIDNSSYVIDTTILVSTSVSLLSLMLPVLYNPEEDLVIVKAIPGDVDHQIQYCHYITSDRYNYADPCAPDDGGVGFSGINGRFVAGFHNYSTQIFPIDAVDHCFINDSTGGNKQYNIIIHQALPNGKPGPMIYISPVLISPPGNTYSQSITHMLTNPVMIQPGSKFFVGYRQPFNQNISACFEYEMPVRQNTFFYTLTDTGTIWTDFAHDSSNYRLDISPRTCKNVELKIYLEGFYNGTSMVSDKVVLELRNFSAPYAIVGTDTSLVDSSGIGYFNFPASNTAGQYYFVVRHRNHLETWSHAVPEMIDNCDDSYNFTDSLGKAFGNNMVFVSSLFRAGAGGYSLYAGDVNQDGSIDASDLAAVDNDSYSFLTGYLATDLNGDSIVDASDALLCDNNAYNLISILRP